MRLSFYTFAILTLLLQFAAADYNCNGIVTTSIYTNLIVDGTSCVLDGATVTGQVIVRNGGNITVQGTTKIFNVMKMNGAGEVKIVSNDHSIPISKIDDVDGTGAFHLCGATVSGGIKVEGRNGFILVGEQTCSDTISHGPIEFSGGSGDLRLNDIKNQLPSLTVTNRPGQVDAVFPSPVSKIDIHYCGYVHIYDATVFDKVRLSHTKTGAAIVGTTANGGMKIENNEGFVCIPNSKSLGVFELKGNKGGVGMFNTKLNHISCEGNLDGSALGPPRVPGASPAPYAIRSNDDVSFNSADGQCTALQSGVNSFVYA